MRKQLAALRERLDACQNRRVLTDPTAALDIRRMELDRCRERLVSAQERRLAQNRQRFVGLTASLEKLRQRKLKKNQPESEENELRRLDRISLMELIVEQRKKIEELEAQLEEANRRLDARSVRLDVENIGDKKDLSRTLRTVIKEVEGGFGTE